MKIKLACLTGMIFALAANSCDTQVSDPLPYGALPSERQLKWHEMEMYNMIEYGPNVFLEEIDWGWGDEDPSLFNPSDFKAERITALSRKVGFKGILVQNKHHGGFCMWDTKTTPYNVMVSPFGRDFTKEWQIACKKDGLKMGVYCSPWDRSTITYGTPEYLDMYREQLKELHTNYGELFLSWFDGAQGKNGYYGGTNKAVRNDLYFRSHYYGWKQIYAMLRKWQPDMVIFSDCGPDLRWIGNEQGYAPETSWATMIPQDKNWSELAMDGHCDAAHTENLSGTRNGRYWIPAEVNTSIRRRFTYHASDSNSVKSPLKLLDIYVHSVGRGHCLDLDLPLNRKGYLDDREVKSLEGFGELLKKTFSENLAKDATITPSNVRGNSSKFGPAKLLDSDRYTYWATDDDIRSPDLLIELPVEKTFNIIRIRENIKLGQRIDSIGVRYWKDGTWQRFASATSIGACRIIRLTHSITAKKIKIDFYAPVCVAVSDLGFFAEPESTNPPVISRNKQGMVNISLYEGLINNIYYTTDGSTPSASSQRYEGPFSFLQSGTIKAISVLGNGVVSDVISFSCGVPKNGWKIKSSSYENPGAKAENAIDENPGTSWNTWTGNDQKKQKAPQFIAVDMGKQVKITAFSYIPQQSGANGVTDGYEYYTSNDGENWILILKGEFSNIRNQPIERIDPLIEPVFARYIKLVCTSVLEGDFVSVAEFGVLDE